MSEQPTHDPGRKNGSILERLRRRTSDEVVGGVASGIGREFGVDPLLVRVAFIAASFMGGAGIILYLAGWILIPEDGSDMSPVGKEFKVESDVQIRTVGLVVAGILALIAALGSAPWMFGSQFGVGPFGWSFSGAWWIATLAIAGGFIYWIWNASRDDASSSTPPTTSAARVDTTPVPFAPPAPGGAITMSTDSPVSGPPPGHTGPPPGHTGNNPAYAAATPLAPTAEESTPGYSALFMLTLSIGAIVLGGLGLWSMVSEPLDWTVYVAAGLGVVALGTLIGIRWGQPTPLLWTGSIVTIVLILGSAMPNVTVGNIETSPRTVAEISEPFTLGMGEITIDLREFDSDALLRGRTLRAENGIGNVVVRVPEDIDVHVTGSSRIGAVRIFNDSQQTSGIALGNENTLVVPSERPGALRLELSTTIGEVRVERS